MIYQQKMAILVADIVLLPCQLYIVKKKLDISTDMQLINILTYVAAYWWPIQDGEKHVMILYIPKR